jgi:type IV fimbrial biogenesis protein FimT
MAAMRRLGGFTMIELMVALSVVAVLATFGLPAVQGMIRNSRLSGQANDLMGTFSFARTEAMKRGSPITVCRSATPTAATPACGGGTGWEDGWVVFIDKDADGVIETADADRDGDSVVDAAEDRDGSASFTVGDVVLQVRGALTGNTLRAAGTLGSRVNFTSQGMASVNGTLTMCSSKYPKYARVVSLAPTGRTEFKRYDGDFAGDCTP